MVANVLCVRGELETEQNCNISTPSSSGYSSTSFSFSWAAQPGALRAASPQSGAGSPTGILSPKLWHQRTELLVALDYIIVWHWPASCGHHICSHLNLSTVKVIPWYLRLDAPVIYTDAFLIWQLGWVRSQYVTLAHLKIKLSTNYSFTNHIYIYIYIYVWVCVYYSVQLNQSWE